MVDFIVELPPITSNNDGDDWWMLYVGGAGITLEGPGQILLEQSLRFDFKTSNNQFKYKALIIGLKLAKEISVKKVRCKSDSKLAMVISKPNMHRCRNTTT